MSKVFRQHHGESHRLRPAETPYAEDGTCGVAGGRGLPPSYSILYPYVPLDHGGQLDGQLIEVGDVQKGIAVDAFDTGLVVADRSSDEDILILATTGVYPRCPDRLL